MLTPSMIAAETTAAITDEQVINLTLLVESAFPTYVHLYSANLAAMLAEEKATPTVKTKVLKAVLTQLDALPAEVVESQGRSDSPTYFTTPQNWKSLALDVLNVFSIRVISEYQSVAIVQRKVTDLLLKDDIYVSLDEAKTGVKY